MHQRIHITLAVLLVAVVGVMVWQALCPQEREPVYRGKGLRLWLREYRSGLNTGVEERVQARDMAEGAVRQIGTNAIPTLLKMLSKKNSSLVSKLIDLWNRHLLWNRYLPRWVRSPHWYKNQAAYLNEDAELGFEILGADAQQAVPALIIIYEQNISPRSQGATSRALNAIGSAAQKMAIPSFLRGVESSNAPVREVAVLALYGVDVEPRQVVPALVKALSDTNWFTRLVAIKGLRHCGTNSLTAIPALLPMLSDPDARVRRTAADALKAIDPEAAAKADVK
jgi:hypothetical protein